MGRTRGTDISEESAMVMAKLHRDEGLSYRALGKRFGVGDKRVADAVRRYESRLLDEVNLTTEDGISTRTQVMRLQRLPIKGVLCTDKTPRRKGAHAADNPKWRIDESDVDRLPEGWGVSCHKCACKVWVGRKDIVKEVPGEECKWKKKSSRTMTG